uniref:SCA7 domain-containing protein n=1 Tax=Callorhinchus milii TaxID=7868 RepID=A0A4W3J0E3_CALMI
MVGLGVWWEAVCVDPPCSPHTYNRNEITAQPGYRTYDLLGQRGSGRLGGGGARGGERVLRVFPSVLDMPIFGHCPAHDEFFLVVCNHCGQVVKPQAFQTHCERRHGPWNKLSARKPPASHFTSSTVLQKSRSSVTQPAVTLPRASKEKVQQQSSANKTTQSDVGQCFSISVFRLTLPMVTESEPLTGNSCGAVTSPCFSAEKECELDKHCGVMDPETKKPCTRSLTCKTHSLTQRRKVLGRRLEFDELLAEHRANTRSKEAAKAGKQQPREPATPAQTQEMAATDSGQPLRESPSVGSAQDEPELETPFPLFRFELDTRISSEESEGETAEEAEKLGCRYSRLHPKPIAFCTFGSRMVGRGCYAFDRRLNHLRSALNSMVERHLNSQMWRKIPPASDCQAVPLSVPAPSAAFLCPQSLSASVSCLPATASSCCPSAVSAQTKPASPSLADPSRTSTTTCALSDPSPLSPPPPVLPPSPPFSKMPSAKSSKSSRLKESPQPGKRKKNAAASVPEPSPKRNCVLGTSRPGSASCAGSSDRSPQRNTPPTKPTTASPPTATRPAAQDKVESRDIQGIV